MIPARIFSPSFPRIVRALTFSVDLAATRFSILGSRPCLKHRSPRPTGARPFVAAAAAEMTVSFGGLDSREMSLVGTLILDLALNWGAWIIAAIFKTEKFYDAVGSLSFCTVALSSLINGNHFHARQIGVTGMILVWTVRLGTFLLYRAIKFGGDSRFKEATEKPALYFVYWTMQAAWVWVCCLPLTFLNAKASNPGLGPSDIIGIILYVTGMLTEVTADFQKLFFKMNPDNRGQFVNVGLWKNARYPNYFGEMLIWWGIFVTSIKGLSGVEFVSVVSPCFVMLLLLTVSGIPLQEKQAKERWGQDPAYQEHRRRTNLLVPIPKFWVGTK
ncbi:hypothetical protein BSKO_13899 [Bryopsis sp. KO-2023]|nr:hypothetical protein BSKO_13899 [Bryopsis sp. KO-2023]